MTFQNTATGFGALTTNTAGTDDTATGSFALEFNKTGINNTADGNEALLSNTAGDAALCGRDSNLRRSRLVLPA